MLLADGRTRGNVEHAETFDAVAEVPAAGVHAERVCVGEAHARPQAPTPAAARRCGVVDLEILARPQNQRRLAARARRRTETHGRTHRRAAVVAERRMLLLAAAQGVLQSRRDQAQIV